MRPMILGLQRGIAVTTVFLAVIIGGSTLAWKASAKKDSGVGPGSTLAGGLMALPPARPLGANVVEKPGWSRARPAGLFPNALLSIRLSFIPALIRCATMQALYAELLHRLPNIVFKGGSPYAFGAWVKSSPGSNLQARIYVFNDTAGTLPVDSTDATAVGTDWTQIVLPDIDVLPLHDGDKLRIRLIVGAPRGQVPSGTLWFDDVTAQPELTLPISGFSALPEFPRLPLAERSAADSPECVHAERSNGSSSADRGPAGRTGRLLRR